MKSIVMMDMTNAPRLELIDELKEQGYTVEFISFDEDALQRLSQKAVYGLILCVSSTTTNAVQCFIRKIKEEPLLKWIPIIVVARVHLVGEKEKYLALGVDDYLIIHQDYSELKLKLRNVISAAMDFDQKAFRDPLTGAYNRRYFFHRIELELQKAQKLHQPISMAFTDADRFKSINDTYGHDVGDLVLIGISRLVQKYIQPTDVLARFGGEEFVVLMPNTDAEQAMERMKKILDIAHQEPVAEHDGQHRFITFSGGVAQWDPEMTVDAWVKLADDAAYTAKRKGRDRIELGNKSKNGIRRILLAEASGQVTEVLSSFAEIQIVSVSTTEEAMQFFLEDDIALCVFETGIPSLDAYRIVKEIKINRPDHDVKFLLLSTRELRQSFIMRCKDCKADAYLCKPFLDAELDETIKKLLEIEN